MYPTGPIESAEGDCCPSRPLGVAEVVEVAAAAERPWPGRTAAEGR